MSNVQKGNESRTRPSKTLGEMPRQCKNGHTVAVHICKKKECWPLMMDVCHPEIATFEKLAAPHLCDSCSGEECIWIFNGPKVVICPGYTGPLVNKRGPISILGAFDFAKDVKYRKPDNRWDLLRKIERGEAPGCTGRGLVTLETRSKQTGG